MLLLTLKFSLGFVLLINIEVEKIYTPIPGDLHAFQSGVPSQLNSESVQQLDPSELKMARLRALLSIGTSNTGGRLGVPQIVPLPKTVCPTRTGGAIGTNACTKQYMVRGLVGGLELFVNNANDYLTVHNASLYHMSATLVNNWFDFNMKNDCKSYGDWNVCARNLERDLLAIGTIFC